jgi:enoyl-CoA hydratase/carnithine racemase
MLSMAGPPVLVERSGSVAEVILNRPERRNAVTGPLADALADAIRALRGDETIATVLLRGAGGAFCSGLDLKEFNASPRPEWTATFQDSWLSAHAALFDCPKTIVGALERFAINGGAALALACDLLVVGRESYLQVGEVQQGLGAPMNLAWLALRHSEAVAARLALVGDRVFGDELLRLGVAYEMVDDGDVLAAARALAARLSAFPASGPAAIKRTLRALRPGIDGADWFARAAAASGRRSGSGPLQAAR